jgi:hypothetical protein
MAKPTAHEYLDQTLDLIRRAYASSSRCDASLRAMYPGAVQPT